MVYANGPASVNGTEIPKSVAIFPGDMLETRQESSANLTTTGSSVMVLADSQVKYEGSSVEVDRGTVRVSTESGFAAHACEVKARPANPPTTQNQFTNTATPVTVTATKTYPPTEHHQA